MRRLKCWWVAALVATSWYGGHFASALAAEYNCNEINAANIAGKTIWLYPLLDGRLAFPGFEGRGYTNLVLGAGGSYTLNATNAAYTRSGTYTATNGFNSPYTWVDVWLSDCPEPGETTKLVLFDFCQFELERVQPTFTNIYEGSYRVTDGAPPTPRPPANITIAGGGTWEVGSTVTLSAQVTGDTPFTYTWSLPGGGVAGATEPTLVLTNVQLADAGTYTVTVANAHGANAGSITLTVINGTAPFIVTPPQSRTNNPGNSFSINVVAGGSVPRSYQWRKEGVPVPGETNDFLFISGFAAIHTGDYDVVVTNNFGSVTSVVATLTLYTGPVITSLTPHLDITNTQPFTLTVTATGDEPMSYQWLRNDTAIPGATGNTYSTNGTSLTGGAYTVRVQNPAGVVTSAVTYVVSWSPGKAWPVIARDTNYTSAASVSVPQGDLLALVGIASGPMPIAFTWRKNGADLPGFTEVPADAVSYQSLGTASTRYSFLTVSNAAADAAGAYTLVTTNPFGLATSSVANVSVLLTNPPVLLSEPTHRTFYLGTTVAVPLALTYTSAFPATVSWFSNNVLLAGLTNASATVLITTNGLFNFRGVVANAYGAVATSNIVVTVKYGDGRLDNFAPPASFDSGINALIPLPEGGVLVGGWLFTQHGTTSIRGAAIVNADGSLNPWRAATNSNVNPLTDVLALYRYPDGRVLAGGFFARVGTSPGRQYSGLARLHADGSVDTDFLAGWDSASQFIAVSTGIGVKTIDVAPDGTIAVGGNFTTVSNTVANGLAFFDANGQFKDAQRPNFSAKVSVIKYQPDGKLLVGGNFTSVNGSAAGQYVRLARLNTDGTVDTSFVGGTNIFLNEVRSLALDAAGNIHVGGAFNTSGRRGVARLFPNGALDTSFVATISSGQVSAIRLDTDGRVIIGGTFNLSGSPRLARLGTNGVADPSFPGGGMYPSSGEVLCMGYAETGRLWIGGSFLGFRDPYAGGDYATRPYLARLEFFSEAPAVTAAPLLSTPAFDGNNFGFTIPTLPGASYRIEYKTDLNDSVWLPYQSLTATGAMQHVIIPAGAARQFFRVVSP